MDFIGNDQSRFENDVTKLMLEVGVPAHLRGYNYLRYAIIVAGNEMEVVESVTKLLYPTVAKHYQTTCSKIERSIRSAIEVSWKRGNEKAFEDLFGYSRLTGKGRPTNSEYIARIADKVRMDFNNN